MGFSDNLIAEYVLTGVTAALVAATVYIASKNPASKARKLGAKLPPGPRNMLVGSLLKFPQEHWYEAFCSWRKEFGDMVFVDLSIAGVNMIVINSLETAEELLGKRAKIYSARPYTTLICDLMYTDWTLLTRPDGPVVHEHRRIMNKCVGPNAGPEHDHLVQDQITSFIKSISGTCVDPFEVITSAVGTIITKLCYGERFDEHHGEELQATNLENIELVATVFTKFWAVDLLPFLRHVPSWFPGAEFRRIGDHAMTMGKWLRFEPIAFVEKSMAEGTADESLLSTLLQDKSLSRENVRDSVTTMVSVSVDTTSSAINNFFYCMVTHPECQKLVQKELDDVVGAGRTPSFAEIQNLPYLNAAWKESLRWKCTVPLGIPHVASEEDVWNGFYIPKGCIMECNVGFMMKDPRIWGDTCELYKPERFLGPNAKTLPDPLSAPFGFGRRICPGRFFANRVALQFIAAALSGFHILPEEGQSLVDSDVVFEGSVQRPLNFRCRFEPRHGN